MEIIRLDENQFESVAEIFIKNYEIERKSLDILPVKYLDPKNIIPLLYDVYKESIGVVAVDHKEIIGYLIGFPLMNFKGSQRGIYCPEWSHAVIRNDKSEVYQKLYEKAASLWISNGCLNHAISIMAHDVEAINIWTMNGFGLHVVDAVRDLHPLSGNINQEIHVRQFHNEDMDQVVELYYEFEKYMASSPIFLPFVHVEKAEEIKQWLEDANNNLWVGLDHGSIISIMETSYKKSNDVQILSDEDTISIGITYTRESHRGHGITKTILSHIIKEASQKGYQRCAVVFESQNSNGRKFWLKYFEPVCYSLVRKVDDRITWANPERNVDDIYMDTDCHRE